MPIRRERPIHGDVDVEGVRRWAREAAASAGLPPVAAAEVDLVASELANNLLRHASGGVVSVEAASDDGRPCVRIEASDEGPGIDDIELALTPGFSTAGGLGEGLPMAKRLSDRFAIHSCPEGTRIVSVRWST
ncbi:hypothetical protein AYO38_02460 [bacterium SCGC AG-212-C10]|nr:hypothetical protein AYO38_02460 [bacterium SCGC AG-212-C10]